MMRGAREMGDEEVYQHAKKKYDELGVVEKNGALHYQGSVLNQLAAHIGRFGTKDSWHRLVHGDMPAAIHTGPVLKSASYPEVLVAAADNDGATLELVLCAGKEAGPQTLELARLIPEQRYRIDSTHLVNNTNPVNSSNNNKESTFITADSQGNFTLNTTIDKRTRIVISPE